MRNSPLEEYHKLADISLSLDNDPYGVKTESLIEDGLFIHGTHAFTTRNEHVINFYSHWEKKHNTFWYRSSETFMSEIPYVSWLSKRKWPLNEQLNLHMLNYQEV